MGGFFYEHWQINRTIKQDWTNARDTNKRNSYAKWHAVGGTSKKNSNSSSTRGEGEKEQMYFTEGTVYKRTDGRYTAKLYIDGIQKTIKTSKFKYVVVEELKKAIDTKRIAPTQQKCITEQRTTPKYTLYSWLDYWMNIYKSKLKSLINIKNCIEHHIKPFIQDKPLHKINVSELDELLLQNPSSRMAEYTQNILKQALYKAYKLKHIKHNIADDLVRICHVRKEGTALTQYELDTLLRVSKNSIYHNAIKLYLLTGCRAEELFSIKGNDIDYARDTLHIHGTKTNNSDRVIPLFPDVKNVLKQMDLSAEQPILTYSSNALKQYLKRLNAKGYSFKIKDLRTTFATMCAEMVYKILS